MNKKHWGAVLAFSGLAIACGVAPSATWARSASHSHFDNRFYLTPSATYTLTENGRATNNGIGAGLAFGKRLTRFLEVEIITTWTRYKVTDNDKRAVMASQVAAGLSPTPQPNATRLLGIGGGINVFAFTDFSGLFSKWGLPFMSGLFDHLYVHGAILHSFATGQPGASAHNYQGNLFDAGLGYDIPLSFWDGAAIRLQALYRLDQHDQKDTGLHAQSPSGNYDEKVFSVGLRIPLGSRTSAAPRNNTPPSPVHIVQTQPAVVPPTPTPAPPPPCNAPQAGQTLHLVGCASDQRLVLHGVNFNLDKASLTPKAETILAQVASDLQAHPEIKIELDGYTDDQGAASYNLNLSKRRADTAKLYLVMQHGIAGGRIATHGFGEDDPIASNKTEEGRAKNRRVELKIVSASDQVRNGTATPPAAPEQPTTAPAAAPNVSAPTGGAPTSNPAVGGAPPGAASAPVGGAPAGAAPAPAGGAPAPAGSAPAGGAPTPAGGAPAGGAPTPASGASAPAGSTPAGGAPAPAGGAPAGGAPPM